MVVLSHIGLGFLQDQVLLFLFSLFGLLLLSGLLILSDLCEIIASICCVMADKKMVTVSNVIPVMLKITEHKLTGANYMDWSKTIRLYLRSIDKNQHMLQNPPQDESRQTWLREDARLFLQICNSIDNTVIDLINHCEYVKELLDYLDFLYSGKGNISRIYEVCQAFYRAEKQDRSLTTYFMDFKKTYEEFNMVLPFSSDVKVQHNQREQMAIMSFLAGLPPEFETAKSQILSSSEISSLHDFFSRILRTEGTPSVQYSSAIVSQNHKFGSSYHKSGSKDGGSNTFEPRASAPNGIVCNIVISPAI